MYIDKLSRKNIYLWKKLDLNKKVFGLQIWVMLNFTGFGLEIIWQQFIIIHIRYFICAGLEITWTSNLDFNHYILWDLDFKVLGLQIWISIATYLTGFGLENTWTTNLDYGYWILLDLDLEILGLSFRIMIDLYASRREVWGLPWFVYQRLNKLFVSSWFRYLRWNKWALVAKKS